MISVALPNHATELGWLPMESLCRQITLHDWELIVYEDNVTYIGGREFYVSYEDRLAAAGCKKIKYIYSEERVPLCQKWITMAEMAEADSLGIILQGSDDYSEPLRVNTAHEVLSEGFDYLKSEQGIFYHAKQRKMMRFAQVGGSGLNIAISLRAVRSMPKKDQVWQSVDSWLFRNLPICPKIHIDDSDNHLNGIFTDGFNRISKSRRLTYINPTSPFYKFNVDLDKLIPNDVVKMLKKI